MSMLWALWDLTKANLIGANLNGPHLSKTGPVGADLRAASPRLCYPRVSVAEFWKFESRVHHQGDVKIDLWIKLGELDDNGRHNGSGY